jgi:hypothetical protein
VVVTVSSMIMWLASDYAVGVLADNATTEMNIFTIEQPTKAKGNSTYWSLKTVSKTLPFSPRMQIKFFALLDVFFSIEASPSTIALISTPPI